MIILLFILLAVLFYYILIKIQNDNIISEYFEEKKEEHKYTADEIYSHLSFISQALRMNKIKHWIMYGTLLGAVRDKDIISYDYDFDLGAHIQDTEKIMQVGESLQSSGYIFSKPITAGYNYNSLSQCGNIWRVSIKIEYKGIIMGDIYLYDNFEDGLTRRFDKENGIYFWPNSTFPTWFIEELEEVRIRDRLFYAPRSPEVLLEHWYGNTWTTPIKAQSQGGKYDPDFDFYGGYKNMRLSKILNYVKSKGINICPRLNNTIKQFYPKEQKQWIQVNDPPANY